MASVAIKNHKLYVRGKEVPLLSGEMHYWRLNPSSWPACLKKIREMGIRIVSTYVPWDYHEYRRGKFDFHGRTEPSRNLVAFLKLLKKEGFWVIIRPGPYIYSEWPNDGVPDYAHEYHRLHPQFLKCARIYLNQVCRVLRPFLTSRRAGHIILLQADNEVDPWPDFYGCQYGLIGKPGLFQEFLRKKYENNLDSLNEAWGAQLGSFNDAGPYFDNRLEGERELRRVLDYYEFKHDYSFQVANWTVSTYQEFGIDIPIYLNLYPFFYAHDWAKLQETCDLTGIDLYPESEFLSDPSHHRTMMDKIRFLRTVSPIPFIAEFAAGIWHDRHYETGIIPPNHYRLICLTALLAGAVGWNWYMLVNRDNWYMSPLNEWGRERRELFDVFVEMVKIFKKMSPAHLEKLTDMAVTYNAIQYAARTAPKESATLLSLYGYDIDYELYDPRRDIFRKKILFYSGNQWLDEVSQANLLRYVQEGGVLVAFRNFPRKGDDFTPLNLLGFADPQSVLFEFRKRVSIQLGSTRPVLVTSSVCTFKGVPGRPVRAEIEGVGRQVVGYLVRKGKGAILHLGVEPNGELISHILRYFKVPVYSRSVTPDVKTALYRKGQTYYLVVVNNGLEEKSAFIYLEPHLFRRGRFQVRDLSTDELLQAVTARQCAVHAEIPRKDGRVFKISQI